MAEFQEVMRQWNRMCEGVMCKDCKIELHCASDPCSRDREELQLIEQTVMAWAAEHPEPKYPTWAEWLESVHVLTNNKSVTYKDGNVTYGTKYYQSVSPNTEFYQPIPADIAEKLGIKPKEADHGNV